MKETVLMLRGKSYEKDVNSGCELVTPENMYNSEIEKLLFPFNTLKLIMKKAIIVKKHLKKVKYLCTNRKYLTFFWKIFHYNCADINGII